MTSTNDPNEPLIAPFQGHGQSLTALLHCSAAEGAPPAGSGPPAAGPGWLHAAASRSGGRRQGHRQVPHRKR